MLVKGMKVKLQDHDDRYMCINEDGKIVKRYVDNKCNDFVYTTLRAEWLMDEGEEFKEPPKKKYLISLKRKIPPKNFGWVEIKLVCCVWKKSDLSCSLDSSS